MGNLSSEVVKRIICELSGKAAIIRVSSLRRRQVNLISFLHIYRVTRLFKLGEWKIAFLDFTKASVNDAVKKKTEKIGAGLQYS